VADDPEFFTDRSLGRKAVPDALRASGLVVHTMASVYKLQLRRGRVVLVSLRTETAGSRARYRRGRPQP
jgi:hypothetical protein